MAKTKQNKIFEYVDSFDTKVGLVEVVAGWKHDLRVRVSGVDVDNTWSNREVHQSASMPIKSPEELADFVTQLRGFLQSKTAYPSCDFSLGNYGRYMGMLKIEKGQPAVWHGLQGSRSTGARYGFKIDRIALEALLAESERYLEENS